MKMFLFQKKKATPEDAAALSDPITSLNNQPTLGWSEGEWLSGPQLVELFGED